MNIAERLKGYPRGTKLYSPILGEVTFVKVNQTNTYPIVTKAANGGDAVFTSDGRYFADYVDAECMLFPSKENRDWNTFKVNNPQFPTTFEECCKLLNDSSIEENEVYGYRENELYELQMLLICRDAWWKVDSYWRPDWTETGDTWKYVITNRGDILFATEECVLARILSFRTEEIRDKFLEIFRNLIEDCKDFI